MYTGELAGVANGIIQRGNDPTYTVLEHVVLALSKSVLCSEHSFLWERTAHIHV